MRSDVVGPNRDHDGKGPLASMSECSLRLNTAPKSTIGILQFPAELLGEIFLFLACSSPLESWYSINHVCRQWRDTALGTAALWTRPPTHCHELALLMLERSRQADLFVEFGPRTALTTINAILHDIERIRSLSYANCDYLLPSGYIFDCLRQPHSRLRELNISHKTDGLPYDDFSLRFDWKILPLPNLTHLTLDRVDSRKRVTIPQFLSTLGDMPNLESLSISQSTVIPFQHLPSDLPYLESIRLPRLVSFDVFWRVSHSQVIYLLSHLQLPQLNRLLITCDGDDGEFIPDHSEFTPFLRAILTMMLYGNFGSLDSLVICDQSDNHWFSLAPGHQFRGTGVGGASRCCLEAELLDYEGFQNATQNFTMELIATLHDDVVAHLVTVEILGSWPSNEDALWLFGRLQNVENLAIRLEDVPALTVALSIPYTHPASAPLPVLPKLKEISIVPAGMRRADLQALRDFSNCLKARYRHGHSVKKLHLPISRFPELSDFKFSIEEVGIEVVNNSH